MILPQHSDDNKYDDNKYDNNQYDDNKYGLMASWPHSGWPCPALVASRQNPGWPHYHLSLMILPQHRSSDYHNKSQLIIMIWPIHISFA